MPDGKNAIARTKGLSVLIKNEPIVPDWPKRVARMREAAERIKEGAGMVKEATEGTLWKSDGLDIATQIEDLVNEGDPDGNSVLDLVKDIEFIEEVDTCQKSKSSSRRVR
jgi:hypothetical protein